MTLDMLLFFIVISVSFEYFKIYIAKVSREETYCIVDCYVIIYIQLLFIRAFAWQFDVEALHIEDVIHGFGLYVCICICMYM